MSSTANLQTDTLGVPPKAGDEPCRCGKHTVKRHASLTLADHAGTACDCGDHGCEQCRAETLTFLDMLGLPPRERRLRTSVGSKQHQRSHAEGSTA